MKTKIRIIVKILLVIAAITALIYNISTGKAVAYISSVITVCGTIAILAQEIYSANKGE